MSDYIKREDASKVICGECLNYAVCYSGDVDIPVCPLFWEVQNIPTADVVERKRGEWREDMWLTTKGYSCSECNGFVTNSSNFCPNCGADMRKGGDK